MRPLQGLAFIILPEYRARQVAGAAAVLRRLTPPAVEFVPTGGNEPGKAPDR